MNKKLLFGALIAFSMSSNAQTPTTLFTDGFESSFSQPYQQSWPQYFKSGQWEGFFGTASVVSPYAGQQCLQLMTTTDAAVASNYFSFGGSVAPGYAATLYNGLIESPASVKLDYQISYSKSGNDFAAILVYVCDTLGTTDQSDDVVLYQGGSGVASSTNWMAGSVTVTATSNANNGEANQVKIFAYSSYSSSNQPGTFTDGTRLFLDDMKLSYINTAGIKEMIDLGVSTYPNPAQNVLNIDLKENIESIQIFSLDGKSIISQEVNAMNAKIDVSTLLSGSYIYKIKTIDGNTFSKSFIKE